MHRSLGRGTVATLMALALAACARAPREVPHAGDEGVPAPGVPPPAALVPGARSAIVVPPDVFAGCPPERSRACAEAAERSRLSGAAPHASRDGGILRLACREKPVALPDNLHEGQDFVVYHFLGHLAPARLFLVRASFYAGHGYLLVDDGSGVITPIDGLPVFSPSGERLVSMNLDLEAGTTRNATKVFRRVPRGLLIEYEMEHEGWGPESPVFRDEETIEFDRVEQTRDAVPPRTKAVLSRRSGRWVLVEAASAGSAAP